MKVAIIGGGWIGCHLANVLKEKNEVVLYEKSEIFSGSSFLNQNRLHLGYHYSRSYNTRLLCKNTFNKFYNQYSFLVDDIQKNVYSIPFEDSLIDFGTYLKIFEDFDTHKVVNFQQLKNIEGSILVEEKYINPIKSKKFFEEQLKDIIEYKKFEHDDVINLSSKYDLVINATNNNLCPITENTFKEKCVVLLYKKVKLTEFDALTLVDGKLMSIYPYDKEKSLYSFTDVEFTPKGDLDIGYIKKNMESKILKYYENFLTDFEYHSYVESIKCKVRNLSDTRVPLIKQNNNIVNCFTGKIQGIYLIEDYIKSL